MDLKKRWQIAVLFVVAQTVVTFVYTNISVNDQWTYVGVAVLVFLCSMAINLLLSLIFSALIALISKKNCTYRARFMRLLPIMLCVFAVFVAILFVLSDYV